MTQWSAKWDASAEIPDLTGKVAIVTGANTPTGIGFHIARQLAVKGAKVYIGARNTQKAQDAIETMRQQIPNMREGVLKPLVVDLGNLHEVDKVAQEFTTSENRLDILVNNAGLLARPFDKNEYGISVSFTTNHLGPFLLTSKLLPLLEKSAQNNPGARIVNVSSMAHHIVPQGIRLNSIEAFNQVLGSEVEYESNRRRYGLSKLANVLFAKELQRYFDAVGVSAIATAVNPGVVKTDSLIKLLGEESLASHRTLSVAEGALTPLFAAASPVAWDEKEKYGGAYLVPFGVVEDASMDASDEVLAKELWVTSERVVNEVLAGI